MNDCGLSRGRVLLTFGILVNVFALLWMGDVHSETLFAEFSVAYILLLRKHHGVHWEAFHLYTCKSGV